MPLLRSVNAPFRQWLWLTLLCVLVSASAGRAWALEPVVVSAATGPDEIGSRIQFVRDPNSLLSLNDVRAASWSDMPPEASSVNFGYMAGTVWLRFVLRNSEATQIRRYVEVAYPVLDHVRIVAESHSRILADVTLGDKYPFASRPVLQRNFVVPVDLDAGADTTIYLQVSSTSSVQLPITVWDNHLLMAHTQNQYAWYGLYFGAMFVLMGYNLFLFLTVREGHYFFYVMYMGAVCLFMSAMNGLSFQYLWPEATSWNDRSILVGLGLIIVFAGIFTVKFLDLARHQWFLNRGIQIAIVLAALECMAAMFLPYRTCIVALIATAVVAIAFAMMAGALVWSNGYRPAMIYCIAWFTFLLGGLIMALNKFGIVPRNLFTENALQLGSAMEGVLLSIALADRLNEEKTRRFQAQKERLEHEKIAREAQAEALEQEKNARVAQERALMHEREAREAQATALKLQQRANETLEQKVRERTIELEIANAKLQELSLTDGLTGIRNRRYFDRQLDEMVTHSYLDNTPMALLLLDIDHFKVLNDHYGHLVGDDCLRLIASVLNAQVHRDNDRVTRYGGEEFALLLPDTDEAGAMHIAEKVRAAIEATPFHDEQLSIPMTVSIGVRVLVAVRDADPLEVIEQADQALYAAKTAGRNRVMLWAPPVTSDA